MDTTDITNRFEYHAPTTQERATLYHDIRAQARGLAEYLNEQLPDGREKSLAITHLEETVFWANAAIARSAEPPGTPLAAASPSPEDTGS